MLRVVAIHDLAELDRYHLPWKRLLAAQTEVSFPQSIAYWRALAELGEVRILAVERSGELLGIAPFYRASGTQVAATPWTGGPWQAALGWRIVGTNPTLVMLAVWRWWREQGDSSGNVELAGIESVGERERLLSTLSLVGDTPQVIEQSRSVIGLEHLVTEIAAAEIAHSHWLRYRPQGNACGDGEACEYLLDACRAIAPHSFTTQTIPPAVHAAAAACGALDLAVLLRGDVPVAFWYSIRSMGRLTLLAQGCDLVADDNLSVDAWRQWLVEGRELGEREVAFDTRQIAIPQVLKPRLQIAPFQAVTIAVKHSRGNLLRRLWPFRQGTLSGRHSDTAAH